MELELAVLGGSLLVVAAVVGSVVAGRLGVPALLLFLGLGMLAGSDGPGGVAFDDADVATAVGVPALAVILFDGGLGTRWSVIRPVLAPGTTLATLGTVTTAAITGSAAAWILGVPIEVGLLLGAIVSSTDAAAVFSVLRTRPSDLAGSIRPTLELESGANDPMAIFLTITLLEIVESDAVDWWSLPLDLTLQLVVGLGAGLAAGWLGRLAVNRVELGISGLYPVLILAWALATYATTTLLGGSGYLAVYVCGAWFANHGLRYGRVIAGVVDATAWLAQIVMFLVLGLFVFPHRLPGVALESLAVAVVLVVVARPLAVALSLTPFRIPRREQAVVAWVGLRGATPILLATFPLVVGIPEAQLLFDVVFFVVVGSVLVQGTTVGLVAERLRMAAPKVRRPDAPLAVGEPLPDGTGLRQHLVGAGSAADGSRVLDLDLPRRALIVLLDRDGSFVVPDGGTELAAGDGVWALSDERGDAVLRDRFEGG